MELAKGIEPSTCWLQVSCSTIEPRQQAKIFWWAGMDSNHRRHSRRIYSPLHLAALQPTHVLRKLGSTAPWFFSKTTSAISPLCSAFKKWKTFFEVPFGKCNWIYLKILVSCLFLRLGLFCILSYTGAEARIEPHDTATQIRLNRSVIL